MMFWRKKTNLAQAEQEEKDDKILHHKHDLTLEPFGADESAPDDVLTHELNETESEIIEELPDMLAPTSGVHLFDAPVGVRHEPHGMVSVGGGWLSRLSSGLTKSSYKISQNLSDFVTKKKLDRAMLSKLEDMLIEADVGPGTAAKIIARFTDKMLDRDADEGEIRQALGDEIAEILRPCVQPLVIAPDAKGPFVMLVCGVNGAGKTTTIGKLAKIMHDKKHHRVVLVAGDTFRAAAVEQLQAGGARAHCPVITRDIGADSAALAYESYAQACKGGAEVMMMDTAGRLHNKSNLMAELQKIVRVLGKHGAHLPHETILVLDGTTGQNAFAQVEAFKDMVKITGLMVTKLDGSAKGGVVVGLADKFGLPIYAVGVGEEPEDLNPFTAEGYARSLMGLPV